MCTSGENTKFIAYVNLKIWVYGLFYRPALKIWIKQLVFLTLYFKNLFNKCEQIRMTLRIWLHLLEEALTKNSIFCAVLYLIKKYLSENFNSSL